ncbi:MAG: HD domain-containing protein, partial [Ruminococcus sp.]|nr:HD domain-containing protein [Ruminococcus sp.]
VLCKHGKLTEQEFLLMKSHPIKSGKIVINIKRLATISEWVKSHHEKWDGNGYPEGLAGEEIPLSARVMAVADVFDALVSRRSYKEPFAVDKALDIIREGSGNHFDPLVVKAFLDAEDEVRRVQKLNMEI